MRIACLGGGPAGLYFAISAKLRRPGDEIHVFERNRAGETFGWGVVFSDQTMANLTANDAPSAARMAASLAHWDDVVVAVGDRSFTSSGHGFIGIGRRRLLAILAERAEELGVHLHFEHPFSAEPGEFADYDLVVAADGINSQVRSAHAAQLGVTVDERRNRFCWLGTTRLFDAFAFLFEQTEAGWVWAHAYRFDETHSTFIVECSPETWRGLGLDTMDSAASIALCERIFARHLGGHPLISNATHLRGSAAWLRFNRIACERWSVGNIVLLGDAAHTAHFSIGSGTKLALEDAIALARAIAAPDLTGGKALQEALAAYHAERHVEVLKIQNSARNSTEWFEAVDRYIGFDLPQFAYALMTRSQRVSHENLRLRDPAAIARLERWFADDADAAEATTRPMFTPYSLRANHMPNRVVVPAMLTYSADQAGRTTPFHAVHYGARALGGAGLIVTETLAVSPEGRATPACPGLWDDAQVAGWRDITAFAHASSKALVCAQIGHAGARGSCMAPDYAISGTDRPPADIPLPDPWPLVAASPLPWAEGGLIPAEADEAEMDRITQAFASAATRAAAAGFDMVEIHAGHGSLLAGFVSPALNRRSDGFGGPLANRLRFVLRVVAAVRAAWPQDRALLVRFSAHDWLGEAGTDGDDAVAIAIALRDAGVDLIDVSSGETSPLAAPARGRLFQTPLADRIRNEAGIPVIAVGNIVDADQVNSIVMSGRADLVALGRPHLADPAWTMRASAHAGDRRQFVPPPYIPGQEQARRLAIAGATTP